MVCSKTNWGCTAWSIDSYFFGDAWLLWKSTCVFRQCSDVRDQNDKFELCDFCGSLLLNIVHYRGGGLRAPSYDAPEPRCSKRGDIVILKLFGPVVIIKSYLIHCSCSEFWDFGVPSLVFLWLFLVYLCWQVRIQVRSRGLVVRGPYALLTYLWRTISFSVLIPEFGWGRYDYFCSCKLK